MNLLETLKNIGLDEKEAKTYLTLLEIGEALPSNIARKSGLKRPTTYFILAELQKKGLVTHTKRGSVRMFRALDPHILLEDQFNKFKQLERIMPNLSNLNRLYSTKPQMTIYEGVDGIISIYEDSLCTKGEIFGWADASIVVDSIVKDYYPIYEQKKVKRNIKSKVILSESKMAFTLKRMQDHQMREIYIVPSGNYKFKNEINLYDDKVAIMAHEDLVGVIIQNASISEMLKSIFLMNFEYAKILEQKHFPSNN